MKIIFVSSSFLLALIVNNKKIKKTAIRDVLEGRDEGGGGGSGTG